MNKERNVESSRYKRGTASHDGKAYGFYPDGSRYRIYDTNERPFAQMVDVDGQTYLRVRQATDIGYVDCPVGGCCDFSYPNSELRRGRIVGGGRIASTLACRQLIVVLVEV